MFTKMLRKIVKYRRAYAGHCSGDGDSGGYAGHCS